MGILCSMTGPDEGSVILPSFSRGDAQEAAKLGLSRAEYEDLQRRRRANADRKTTTSRLKRDGPVSGARPRPDDRIEISEDEYRTLSLIAALARRFFPLLEQTSAPVTHASEFAGLHEALDTVMVCRYGGTSGTEHAVGDLLSILDDTRAQSG